MKTLLIAPLLFLASCSLVRQVTKTNRGTITVDSAGHIGLSDAEISKLADYFQLGDCTWMDSFKMVKTAQLSDGVKLAIIRELTERLHLCDIGQWHSGGGIPGGADKVSIKVDSLKDKLNNGKTVITKSAAVAPLRDPAFTLSSTCDSGVFTLYLTCTRSFTGDAESGAIFLKVPAVPSNLAQTWAGGDGIGEVQSDFALSLRDAFTGSGFTVLTSDGVNRFVGAEMFSADPWGYIALQEDQMLPLQHFEAGKVYVWAVVYYPAAWGRMEIARGGVLLSEMDLSPVPFGGFADESGVPQNEVK